MAFVKRTWLARLGAGLNKFIIGDKDSNGKQELTNSPDSVSQQGDVISADNLNDLEDRIDNQFTSVDTLMTSMKLTKVWENPDPTTSFAGQDINLGEIMSEAVVQVNEYIMNSTYGRVSRMYHIKMAEGSNPDPSVTPSVQIYNININSTTSGGNFDFSRRGFLIFKDGTVSKMRISDCHWSEIKLNQGVWSMSHKTTNSNVIPYAIYKVGDIYN